MWNRGDDRVVVVGVVGERGGQEWESSSLFTGCCGRRGAVGENDGVGQVVSLPSSCCLPSLLDGITCNLSLVQAWM